MTIQASPEEIDKARQEREAREAYPTWVVIPAKDCVEMTTQAVLDCLSQSVPTRVLLVDQGSSRESNDAFRALAEQHHPRLLLWSHNPSLPCLSAAWNRALDFVWACGGTEALVVNNDVRLSPLTVATLHAVMLDTQAWFVSGVGVREGQFDATYIPNIAIARTDRAGDTRASRGAWSVETPGGPDFSCFLIAKAGHDAYRFDERFIPAYCEDLDCHRRYLLGGDGWRIFGVNLPFLHYASGTTKSYTPEQRAKFGRQYEACVQTYARKWGGGPSKELWIYTDCRPRDESAAYTKDKDVRTPTLHQIDKQYGWPGLQRYLRGEDPACAPLAPLAPVVTLEGADAAETAR